MKESDILHDVYGAYVVKKRGAYVVYVPDGITHCTTDSAYDELSLAIARCDWLGNNSNKCALYRKKRNEAPCSRLLPGQLGLRLARPCCRAARP